MIEMDQERKNFEELLPFFVNQTLGAEDLKFMEDYLLRFPALQAQVIFTQYLRDAIKDDVTNHTVDSNWDKLLTGFQEYYKSPSLIERLRKTCKHWGLSPAFGVVLALLVAQSTILLQLGIFSSSAAYRGLSTQATVVSHLKIIANPQTDYAQLVELLRKNGCRVVAGPSENGELWLNLEEPEKLTVIKSDFLNSGLVDDVFSTE